jgi:hypothetical protein
MIYDIYSLTVGVWRSLPITVSGMNQDASLVNVVINLQVP